jgi:hypothetical protein
MTFLVASTILSRFSYVILLAGAFERTSDVLGLIWFLMNKTAERYPRLAMSTLCNVSIIYIVSIEDCHFDGEIIRTNDIE